MRTAAVAAAWRPTASNGDASWLQERRLPAPSQVQTVMDRVLVLLSDGLPPSEITTGRMWTSRSRRRKPVWRVRMDAVLSEDKE